MNATLTSRLENGTLTITLAGDLSVSSLTTAMTRALNVRAQRRLAARATGRGGPAVESVGAIVIDVTGITNLGMVGVGLLRGVYRTAPHGIMLTFHATPAWAPCIRLLSRGAMNVTVV